jgi:eukaryotic-like serine/threonine-protein kinase
LSLPVGTRVGAYEVGALLGAGGMGEVYRARDTKLGREVAFKVLPAAFIRDDERLARLRREARLLAALNHPHIAAIHELEEAEGIVGLALELVEGPTLAERLAARPLPISEALTIARQIADALEAAHEKGIIHRDLKPANIKVTPQGMVKVLDFGLAKAFVGGLDDAPGGQAATTTAGFGSGVGVFEGTAAYMSPEQARGQPVDRRADVWGFGCVVFEMLARRPAFARPTLPETIAALLEHEPDWKALPRATPEGVRRLLTRCLQKEPKRRLHDIADARIELDDVIEAPPSTPPASGRSRLMAHPALWIGGTLALLMLAVALFRPDTARNSPRETRVHRLTDLVGVEEAPALSPDGRSVAFTAAVGKRRQVFVKLLAGGPPLQITRDATADHQFPRWSHDSGSVFYFSPVRPGETQGTIWEASALGGAARRVLDSLGGADVNRADGRLAFFRLSADGIELATARPDGSGVAVVTRFEPAMYYLYPRWSPDGRLIAFQRGDSIRFDVFAVPAGGGDARQLTRENNIIQGFAWLPDSTGILYSSSRGNTMPYLPTSGLWQAALEGGPVRQMTVGDTSYVYPDVAPGGSVVAARLRVQTDIWKFPTAGSPEQNVSRGVRVTNQTGQVLTPTAGPDDTEVAFLSDSGGHANLWVTNLLSGDLRQITHERDPSVAIGLPIWSPDGRRIAFVSSRGNPGLTFGIWLVDPDGSNLRNLANPGVGPAWSHDGQWVYYSTRGDSAVSEVVLRKIPVRGGDAVTVRREALRNVIGANGGTLYYVMERPLVDGTPEFEIRAASPEDAPSRVLARISPSRVPIWQIVNPALSPDGHWLAQPPTDGLTTNIWTVSTVTGAWRPVTDFGDRPTFIARRVSWSSDGQAILAALGHGDADIVLLEGLVGQPE